MSTDCPNECQTANGKCRDGHSNNAWIFWIVIHQLKMLIILKFGYDPDMRNIDQSPFHKNEAGSQACKTLAIKGTPIVPLIENHCATRERWSLNSVTDSSEERIYNGRLPGFEAMFEAEPGQIVAKRLQEHVDMISAPFRVSVVTGLSGSYREEDILAFLEK